MNREAAIEATKQALQREFGGFLAQDPYNPERFWTMTAAAVIDAALPHLLGSPIRYAVVDEDDAIVDDARDRSRLRGLNRPGNRVVALIPVEDAP